MIRSLNIKTIIQSLAVLQEELNETNYLSLIKHTFFSDRYHLRHFGFLYTFDTYFAMKLGPVPSTIKDILSNTNFLEGQIAEGDLDYIKNKIEMIGQYDVNIKEKSENHLSDSIKEALDFSIRNFSQFSKYELANITHDYPEWKNYEKYFKSNSHILNMPMKTSYFFDDPEIDNSPAITKYLNGKDPFADDRDFLELLKQEYLALSA